MASEVMLRTPLLVRWMAVGPLILLLGLAITEDKSYRRQELQEARVTGGKSPSHVGRQSNKD